MSLGGGGGGGGGGKSFSGPSGGGPSYSSPSIRSGGSFTGPSIGGGRTFSGPSIGGDRGFSGRTFSGDRSFSGVPGFRSNIGPRAPSKLFGEGTKGDHHGMAKHHGSHGDHHHGWRGYPWWAWGFGPGWGLGYWGGSGYPGLYDYSYSGPYSYGVASVPYEGGSVVAEQPSIASEGAGVSSDYFNQALNAFRSGNYQEALRLAGHAAIDMRGDARPHELASLALFALKNYQGAAMEAHAALGLGQPADWNTLYSYYNDLPTYERQLDALTTHATQHPDAADAKFLLAYHNLMMGHKDLAQQQLGEVLKLAPNDQLAVRLLESIGGKAPAAAPQNAPDKPAPGTGQPTPAKPQ